MSSWNSLSARQKSEQYTHLSAFFLAFGDGADEEDLAVIFRILAEVYQQMAPPERGARSQYTREDKVEEYMQGVFMNTHRRFKAIMRYILILYKLSKADILPV